MSEWWLEEFRERAVAGDTHLAVDIGANTGDWTAWAATQFDYVVAVECDDRMVAKLKERFAEVPTVTIIHAAAAAQGGKLMEIYKRPSADQTSILEEHPIGACDQKPAPVESVEVVNTISLDDIVKSHGKVDFVKIDVEGGEAIVMAGATKACLKKCRWLIEVHDTSRQVGEQSLRLGYEGCRVIRHPSKDAHPEHYWVFLEHDI